MIYYYDDLEFEQERQFDLYVLRKYLAKYYGLDKALALIKTNAKNIDGLAKALGKKDIGFFCLYFLRELFVPSSENTSRALSKVHYDVFEELNKMFITEKDSRHKEEFILPRGTGKSTIVNTSVACYSHCYGISTYTVVVAKTEDLQHQFIAEVRKCLEFKKVRECFGNLINTKKRVVNKEELELDNDTKVQSFTWNGQIRGTKYNSKRPNIIICDDILKMDDILNDNAKEKCVTKYYTEILPAGDKARVLNGVKQGIDTKFIVIGTPLASDDFINTIREDSSFEVFHRSVCEFDVDDYFTKNKYWQKYREILFNNKNKDRLKDAENYYYKYIDKMKFPTLWEGKYIPFELANDYFTKRLAFMQELMCDCQNVGDIWITYQDKISLKELNEIRFEKTVLTIDQGASKTSRSDFTAFTVLGKSNGFYYVREGKLKKFDSKTEFDLYITEIVNLLKAWKDITHVFLEKNVYKGIDATRLEERIREDRELRSRRIKVETPYSTQNKEQRISTITDKINSGQIKFNQLNEDYNKQVYSYRGEKFTPHDDAIDSLEMAVNNIDQIQTRTILHIGSFSDLYR